MPFSDRYSKFIYWLKLALPLAALLVMSTLFLAPGTIDLVREIAPDPAIAAQGQETDPAIERFRYSGMFGGDDAVVTSDLARLDIAANEINLHGAVDAYSRSGDWRLQSQEMQATLDGATIKAQREVKVIGLMGVIDADTMFLRKNPAISDKYLVDFRGAVKVTYKSSP